MAEFFEEPNLQALLEKIAKDEGFNQPKFTIGPASEPGQNFIGRILRVLITEIAGTKESLSLIFKTTTNNREKQRMIPSKGLFRTESVMYKVVFPALNNFLKKRHVLDFPTFPGVPRCYAAELSTSLETEQADVIVLEDKKTEGFVTVDIKKGITATQCRLALEKIALLHASSMALHELEPETAEYLRNAIINRSLDGAGRASDTLIYFQHSLHAGLELLEEPYKSGNPTYDLLRSIQENFPQEFLGRYAPTQDFFCITHMDFSSNNVLFKINKDGSTDDACVIDFQAPSFASPINDLGTLLMQCTTKETRDDHFEDLLEFYHAEVTRILQACGCDPKKVFPWDLFQKHLRSYMRWGVVVTLMCVGAPLHDNFEFNFDLLSSENRNDAFFENLKGKGPDYIKALKDRVNGLVSDAARWGYI